MQVWRWVFCLPPEWSSAAPCSPSPAAWISPHRCCWWTSRSSECPAAPTATRRGWWGGASGPPQEWEVNKEIKGLRVHWGKWIMHLSGTPNEKTILISASLLAFCLKAQKRFHQSRQSNMMKLYLFLILATYLVLSAHCCTGSALCSHKQVIIKQCCLVYRL